MNSKIKTILFFIIVFVFSVNSSTFAQETDTLIIEVTDTIVAAKEVVQPTIILANGDTTFYIMDSPIVRAMDSALYQKFFQRNYFSVDTAGSSAFNFKPGEIPLYHDSIYNQRIEALNRETPIELTYNQEVKKYIEVYGVKKRQLTAKMLGLAELYFPMFEEALDKYNMPLEIKYLAIVESALNPSAGSKAGAKGLWQFMYGTGKVYGLKVSSMVDDRFDPMKSTIAACEHLTDLYDIYGDWSLALAAYNSGAGNVNRALRRAGGTRNYWAVWPFLPRETRGYVPAFIAVNYIMNYAPEHNIYPMRPGMFFYDIDTVTVNDVLAFDQLNEMIGVPIDELEFLNPQFKENIIPAGNGKNYILRIPRRFTDDFLNNEQSLYAYKTRSGIEKDKLMAEVEKAKNRNIHIVRSGESLGLIANKYRVYVNQLKRWNNLRSNTIYPGQKLVVYGAGSTEFYQKTSTPVMRSSEQSVHVVKSGENLGLIAKKYKCTVTDLREWNSLNGSTIHPSQKLIVYKPDDKPSSSVKEGKYLYHIVRKGDTLWDIAKEYDGVTVDQIKKLNNMTNSTRIQPGQKLKISVVS